MILTGGTTRQFLPVHCWKKALTPLQPGFQKWGKIVQPLNCNKTRNNPMCEGPISHLTVEKTHR